uniref:Uncharacterized protein n=1 Tax=Glossina palpalis gambiensis TaxID=67801 RepID=A0A1B0C1F3_9MUSC
MKVNHVGVNVCRRIIGEKEFIYYLKNRTHCVGGFKILKQLSSDETFGQSKVQKHLRDSKDDSKEKSLKYDYQLKGTKFKILYSASFNVYKTRYGLECMLASDCLLSDLEEVIVVMRKEKEENSGNGAGAILPHIHTHHDGYRTRELGAFEHGLLDGDMFLQTNETND